MSSALDSPSAIAPRGRWLAGIMMLAFSLFAVRACSSAYADAIGGRIAAWLIAVVPTPHPPPEEALAEEEVEEPPFGSAPSVRGAVFAAKRSGQAAPARTAPLSGIRISSAQVLALAARRAMPRGVLVKATAQHPAGLLLSGVSALGVGVQDGDVLTEAAGQKATSVAAVVGVVLAARARQAAEISGRFYRGGVPFSVTVEQPYPKGPVPG